MASHPTDAVVLAEVSRSGFVEGVHIGHAVIVSPQGEVVESWGDPNRVIFPRSSNKPAQATALVNLGLDLPPHLLALAAASHSGEQMHLDAVLDLGWPRCRANCDELFGQARIHVGDLCN